MRLREILTPRLSRKNKDFMAMARLQGELGVSVLRLVVKVDDQQLRKKANDKMGELLAEIRAAKGGKQIEG